MNTKRTIPLTADGKSRLEEELRHLESTALPDLKQRIQEATEEGDVNDNSDYDDLKEEYLQSEARIRELEQTLDRAEIIEEGSIDGTIGLGSHVTVKADDGVEESWVLVGREEAHAPDGRISTESPVGRTLIGCRAGDSATVETPDGPITYTVIDVK